MNSILRVVEFIKENIGQNVAVYAKSAPASYSLLLLNVFENQDGELFDASVLHNGVYDLSKLPISETTKYEYFFG